MTNPHGVTEPFSEGVSVHVLRSAAPTKALLLAALGSIVGGLLIVVAVAQSWPAFLQVVGVVVLIAGVVLFGLAAWTMLRMQVHAELTPTGYSFRTPAGVRHGTWADTVKVTSSESGRRISFHRRDESTQDIVAPVGGEDPAMEDLIADVTGRLRSSRS